MRSRAYRRYQRNKHILRKKRIIKNVYMGDWGYKHDGMLSKGKVHCSCWMCRYHPEWSVSTREEIMKSQLHDFENNNY